MATLPPLQRSVPVGVRMLVKLWAVADRTWPVIWPGALTPPADR